MHRTIKTLAVAGLFAAAASVAGAAPSNVGQLPEASATASRRCTATIARASADRAAGIATIATASAVNAVSGVARVAVPTPA